MKKDVIERNAPYLYCSTVYAFGPPKSVVGDNWVRIEDFGFWTEVSLVDCQESPACTSPRETASGTLLGIYLQVIRQSFHPMHTTSGPQSSGIF